MTHIFVVKLTIIGSDNGLSPGRRHAIIWTNAGILLIEPLGTNFIEILIGIQTFSFNKMHLKMSSAKWRPFCLGLNVLSCVSLNIIIINLIPRLPLCTIWNETWHMWFNPSWAIQLTGWKENWKCHSFKRHSFHCFNAGHLNSRKMVSGGCGYSNHDKSMYIARQHRCHDINKISTGFDQYKGERYDEIVENSVSSLEKNLVPWAFPIHLIGTLPWCAQ